MPGLESDLTSLEARVSRQDGYILVDECSQIGHTTGSVFIAKVRSVFVIFSFIKDYNDVRIMRNLKGPDDVILKIAVIDS
ncbi:hypothetical protein X943_001033 [Babesia divergens]|uniref:Uncharacterized protein n=1 Tax=Babesia divergens TaxID=32595 RepID=A0AAD9LDX4_BABDI|nr:hypothetical protein X943_001033 [Babesia divergens]